MEAVSAVRLGQRVRVRFELPPRLRVEAWGEVRWADSDGCGVCFLELSPRMAQQLDEWIFGDLLENLAMRSRPAGEELPVPLSFSKPVTTLPFAEPVEEDGLIVSPSTVKVIELPARPGPREPVGTISETEASPGPFAQLDWLSQPLSNRSIAWLVNTLSVLAGVLLFAVVFLAVTREAPKWPGAMTAGAAAVVAALYWGFFRVFGGPSPGARLARLMGDDPEDEEEPGNARFR